jgi:rubrerythrin
LAILSVSPADREPEEESDEPEYGTMAWHLSRVADGEQSQYLCPDCNHLHDNDEDTSDNTVQCPDCGEWNNAEESRQDACEHHA